MNERVQRAISQTIIVGIVSAIPDHCAGVRNRNTKNYQVCNYTFFEWFGSVGSGLRRDGDWVCIYAMRRHCCVCEHIADGAWHAHTHTHSGSVHKRNIHTFVYFVVVVARFPFRIIINFAHINSLFNFQTGPRADDQWWQSSVRLWRIGWKLPPIRSPASHFVCNACIYAPNYPRCRCQMP